MRREGMTMSMCSVVIPYCFVVQIVRVAVGSISRIALTVGTRLTVRVGYMYHLDDLHSESP